MVFFSRYSLDPARVETLKNIASDIDKNKSSFFINFIIFLKSSFLLFQSCTWKKSFSKFSLNIGLLKTKEVFKKQLKIKQKKK